MKKAAALSVISAILSMALLQPQQILAASSFMDLDKSDYKEAIVALKEKGFIHGISDQKFQPQTELTAAQGIKMIANSMQLSLASIDFSKAPEAEDIFSNVNNNAWYAESFINAHYNKVDIPSDIDPLQPLTKEQFTHYLIQALETTGQYPTIKMFIQIEDEKDIDTSLQGTIQRALLYKITSLDDEQNFNPKQVMKRDQAAVMIYEAVKFVESHKEG